ncbi:SGNH/GDSL hydrolase family protein [Spirulina subsalsa]|uniref:SGNH/GDSL hydrolase family protein n=1 Tax=Spirulina subsalsa TaxID=54311 RepID=UPI00030A6A75|nr:SGNH/GDSL hydrolase family protein [Spirulina subsalsa]
MTSQKKKYYWLVGLPLGALIAAEVALRVTVGLGNPPLSQADPLMGYRFQPNQNLQRFGNQIIYNQYSQRSNPITPQKPPDTLRILMIGDSVLNGGAILDQGETISGQLQTKFDQAGIRAEVLNASAGSWGIGNQLGYVQRFGFLESDLLILQIGTHDLIQPTSTGDRIGSDPNYPTQSPLLALQELITRYLIPHLLLRLGWSAPQSEIPTATLPPQQQFEENLEDLQTLLNLAQQANIPVLVLYTPDWVDVLPQPSTPTYKPPFVEFLGSQDVGLIDAHEDWSQRPPEQVSLYFRDSVHLTALGNQRIAQLLWANLLLLE